MFKTKFIIPALLLVIPIIDLYVGLFFYDKISSKTLTNLSIWFFTNDVLMVCLPLFYYISLCFRKNKCCYHIWHPIFFIFNSLCFIWTIIMCIVYMDENAKITPIVASNMIFASIINNFITCMYYMVLNFCYNIYEPEAPKEDYHEIL